MEEPDAGIGLHVLGLVGEFLRCHPNPPLKPPPGQAPLADRDRPRAGHQPGRSLPGRRRGRCPIAPGTAGLEGEEGLGGKRCGTNEDAERCGIAQNRQERVTGEDPAEAPEGIDPSEVDGRPAGQPRKTIKGQPHSQAAACRCSAFRM